MPFLRELVLRSLKHPNVVMLLDDEVQGRELSLVFERLDCDLNGYRVHKGGQLPMWQTKQPFF